MKDKKALTASVLFCALSLTIGACSEIPQPPPEVGTLDEYVATPFVSATPVVSLDAAGRIPIQELMYSQGDVVGDCTDKSDVSNTGTVYLSTTIWGSCLTSRLSTTTGPGFVAY